MLYDGNAKRIERDIENNKLKIGEVACRIIRWLLEGYVFSRKSSQDTVNGNGEIDC